MLGAGKLKPLACRDRSVLVRLFMNKVITRMHGSALRCVRSHSRSVWNAKLTPL